MFSLGCEGEMEAENKKKTRRKLGYRPKATRTKCNEDNILSLGV